MLPHIKKYLGENGTRVRDQDHKTGKYRGCDHDRCNVSNLSNRFLHENVHNLTGYANHEIIKEAFGINKELGNRTQMRSRNSYDKFICF